MTGSPALAEPASLRGRFGPLTLLRPSGFRDDSSPLGPPRGELIVGTNDPDART